MSSPFEGFSDEQLSNLRLQLDMTMQTFAVLQSHGVGPADKLRLDFLYRSKSPSQAAELHAFLLQETDYDLRVEGTDVQGTTQPTEVSAEILKNSVFWMCSAGVEHGACLFDGWGCALDPG